MNIDNNNLFLEIIVNGVQKNFDYLLKNEELSIYFKITILIIFMIFHLMINIYTKDFQAH